MEPEHVESILDRAHRLLEAGKPAQTLRCLAQIHDEFLDDDDRVECASLRAWALSEMDRTEEALDILEELLEEFPESARLHGTQGIVLSNADEIEEAREALELAASLDPQDDVALANLALVYEKLREYEQAVETYNQALNLGADIDWTLQRLAAAQSEAGDAAGARATLKRYLSLVPDDAAQWITLAILHSDQREYEQASASYRTAEQLAPDSPWLRLNWGVTAVRTGDLNLARQQLEHLQRVTADSSQPLLLHAFILEEEERLDDALPCYERALERAQSGDYAELTYTLEMALDFFARHGMTARCERLLHQAYAANTCTVELCEAYREVTGERVARAFWFSLVVESDYRAGLSEVPERAATDWPENGEATGERPFTRFLRNYQVVAKDRDDATALTLDFVRRMGERGAVIREFINEEPIEDTWTGIYEVEKDSLVFADEDA